ncbi:hypothetical protein VMCG_00160 [Cytospora schulzeri]|uniref:Ricin B lectin domain-containing protein n=1 Tax=Cytospora schulzeri TaxID=448051 RepID=A0A423X898_9PEZI|nr:hypothetical protein VMCG_00160 [Valsa malicola]
MAIIKSLSLLALAAYSSADPIVWPQTVPSLDEAAAAKAQQRDDTATRALSNTHIKTSDGKCLFVDRLSGDSRANLTPVKVANCGSTDGQGWDVITAGKHINMADSMLVVSTLTNACFDFDPRGPVGGQVSLYSCGGSPDGSGSVTASQIFPFNGEHGPLALRPNNGPGKCLSSNGTVVNIAECDDGDVAQKFTFEGNGTAATATSTTTEPAIVRSTTADSVTAKSSTASPISAQSPTATPTATKSTTAEPTDTESIIATRSSGQSTSTSKQILVSGAGNALNPSAVAEAHQRDDTAVRAFSSVSIRTHNGQCLSVDRTAGDYRENLIPVSLIDCDDGVSTSAMWDFITKGKHNDGSGGPAALVVNKLTQGCISYDFRRNVGDQVLLFSCGGRADGTGSTNAGQLFPFTGETRFELAPVSEGNTTCIIPGNGRLDAGPCTGDQKDFFSVANL